jgi:putative acetyltransferase
MENNTRSAEREPPVTLRAETRADYEAIDHVNHLAFSGEEEVTLIRRLREDGDIRLSLVAELDGQVVGNIVLSKMVVDLDDGRRLNCLALAPVAVLPDWQKRGIGAALIRAAVERARGGDEAAIILVGHADYYPRFGFSSEVVSGVKNPFNSPEHFMGLELRPDALQGQTGSVRYASAFGLGPDWTF